MKIIEIYTSKGGTLTFSLDTYIFHEVALASNHYDVIIKLKDCPPKIYHFDTHGEANRFRDTITKALRS